MLDYRTFTLPGAHRVSEGIHFSYASQSPDCGVLLYKKGTGELLERIPFPQDHRIGRIYSMTVKGYSPDRISYLFYEGEQMKADPYAYAFEKSKKYGEKKKTEDLRALIPEEEYDWGDDKNPMIPYEDAIIYGLHMRGFTAHASSKVTGKGTFYGLKQKIPYLKELGVTTLELQPIYEFVELEEEKRDENSHVTYPERLNYWGYKRGFYFAPKASYCYGDDPVEECREMIRCLHENNMEAVLQFYFPSEVLADEIIRALHYWVLAYHVDGFHLMGDRLPITSIARDPLLADTKIWYYDFDTAAIYGEHAKACETKNLAVFRDDYCYQMRRFLKGDDNVLPGALTQMRQIPMYTGKINFFSNYDGFTLMDMVSYDRKHNEENGEDNRDGKDVNLSWNCGEEGKTRKKKVVSLRIRQIENALCMLFFSAGTPFVFMGDEFGRSQNGNNNPYCQDNETTWMNWRDAERNPELLSFFRMLSKLRREHGVLRRKSEARIMDSLSCGYPDLSYHGKYAWRLETDGFLRCAGIMYCGYYGTGKDGGEDDFLYLGINMYWEPQNLALPRLPQGRKWKLLVQTDEEQEKESDESVSENLTITVAPRSVRIFISVMDESKKTGKGKLPSDRQAF